MIAIQRMWLTDRWRLIGLAGALVAVAGMLLNLDFFFKPGTSKVLGGLAHHAFVLGWMLILTSGTRTVSWWTLGGFWLLGVWGVYGVAYVVESEVIKILGKSVKDEFVTVWLAPLVEEGMKLLPVLVFMLVAGRRKFRRPSMSDGMLLGFMVGAGVSFQEDAHFGKILVSGDGWDAASPWSLVFPTISPLGKYFALNHALWAALSGLSIGAAIMMRRWVWAWPIALAGPLLAFTNHLMANHYTFNAFGTQALLNRAGGSKVPWFYETVRDLTMDGRVPMLALVAGAVAVVLVETSILRWVGKRDRRFPSISPGHILRLITQARSKAGIAQLLSADGYLRLRRRVYFAGWLSSRAGEYPGITDADHAALITLGTRSEVFAPAAPAPSGVPAG